MLTIFSFQPRLEIFQLYLNILKYVKVFVFENTYGHADICINIFFRSLPPLKGINSAVQRKQKMSIIIHFSIIDRKK